MLKVAQMYSSFIIPNKVQRNNQKNMSKESNTAISFCGGDNLPVPRGNSAPSVGKAGRGKKAMLIEGAVLAAELATGTKEAGLAAEGAKVAIKVTTNYLLRKLTEHGKNAVSAKIEKGPAVLQKVNTVLQEKNSATVTSAAATNPEERKVIKVVDQVSEIPDFITALGDQARELQKGNYYHRKK